MKKGKQHQIEDRFLDLKSRILRVSTDLLRYGYPATILVEPPIFPAFMSVRAQTLLFLPASEDDLKLQVVKDEYFSSWDLSISREERIVNHSKFNQATEAMYQAQNAALAKWMPTILDMFLEQDITVVRPPSVGRTILPCTENVLAVDTKQAFRMPLQVTDLRFPPFKPSPSICRGIRAVVEDLKLRDGTVFSRMFEVAAQTSKGTPKQAWYRYLAAAEGLGFLWDPMYLDEQKRVVPVYEMGFRDVVFKAKDGAEPILAKWKC